MPYRAVAFRCPLCTVSKETNQQIIAHLISKHWRKLLTLLSQRK